MKLPSLTPKTQLAFLVATAMCVGATELRAQTANVATVSGTATANGRIKRSIIDITKPGREARGLNAGPRAVTATTDVVINVTPGQTADQVGWNLCAQARTQLQPLGYTVTFFRPSPAYQDVEFIRPTGSFIVVDSVQVPGVAMTSRFIPLNNGSAATPWTAGMTTALLAAFAFQQHRRKAVG